MHTSPHGMVNRQVDTGTSAWAASLLQEVGHVEGRARQGGRAPAVEWTSVPCGTGRATYGGPQPAASPACSSRTGPSDLPARYFADDTSLKCNVQRRWCARGAGCMPDCGALPDINSAGIAFDPYRFNLQAAAGTSPDAAEVPKHETRGQMLQRHKRVRQQVYNTSAMVPSIAYADKVLMHVDRNQHSTLDCAGGEGSQRRSEKAGQKT